MRTEGQDSREVRNLLGMNTDSVERHAHVSDPRPPWGDSAAKEAAESASAEATHGCLHTAAGSGKQSRDLIRLRTVFHPRSG